MSRGSARATLVLLVLLRFAAGIAEGASAAELNEAGKQAYQRGDHARAEQLFRQAIAQAPSDPLLHYHRGIALSRLSRWTEAAGSYESALRLTPPAPLAASIREALRSASPFLRPSVRFDRGSEDFAIPLERVGGGWLAEVIVNGTRSARFLVDTGASVCVIGPALASELGIGRTSETRTIELQTLSGRTSGSLVNIPSLRVGDIESQDVAAVIHETGPRMEGILGNTFLARFTVILDPDHRVLILKPR